MSDPVDPERPRSDQAGADQARSDQARDANEFDRPDGYSGQGYTIGRELAQGARGADPAFRQQVDGRDLPPDEGHRASIDRDTGEVHGSGASIGGGNPGEDFDSATPSGDAFPITGGEGTDKTPGDLGPKNDEATYL